MSDSEEEQIEESIVVDTKDDKDDMIYIHYDKKGKTKN